MQRIDMSEYMEKHAVARLIGAPPGYVGYDEGRRPFGSRAPAALPGGAVRRGREGAPGRLQRPPAGARRRAADRRPRPHRGLPQHADRAHVESRRRGAGGAARRRRRRRRPRRGDGRGARGVPPRVPQPPRRDGAVPPPRPGADGRASSTSSSTACAPCWRRARSTSRSISRPGPGSRTPAGTRYTAPARSSGPSSARSRTRWRRSCSKARSATATRCRSALSPASRRSPRWGSARRSRRAVRFSRSAPPRRLLVADGRPDLVGLGDVAGNVLLPAGLDVLVEIQVQRAVDDGPRLGSIPGLWPRLTP